MFTQEITYPAAFIAGLLSFFSPCILPLIPAYFTYITGYSIEELTGEGVAALRANIIRSTAAYICGFSIVFILMGASASLIGGVIFKYKDIIRIVGGILIIALGIHLTGVIRFTKLDIEKRVHFEKKPLHLFGNILVGMAFGAGWSPCIGPLLGSILIVAGNQDTVMQGIALLAVYSAGLAIPFLIISVFINFLIIFIRRATKFMAYLNASAGILLILIGLLLVTNKLYFLNI
jgi:cytochrome c-type biogenesis protein